MWLYCFCNFGNQVFPGLPAVASDLWPPARNQFALEGDAPELQEYPQGILKQNAYSTLEQPARDHDLWPSTLTEFQLKSSGCCVLPPLYFTTHTLN